MAETRERALGATPLRRRGPHAPERVETKLVGMPMLECDFAPVGSRGRFWLWLE